MLGLSSCGSCGSAVAGTAPSYLASDPALVATALPTQDGAGTTTPPAAQTTDGLAARFNPLVWVLLGLVIAAALFD